MISERVLMIVEEIYFVGILEYLEYAFLALPT
jgi:hypothetical protein